MRSRTRLIRISNLKRQKADKTESDDEKNEEKDNERESESDDFGNLKNLKKEFDNLNTHTDTSQKDETRMQDASADTDDEKKDKVKGSVDDA